MTTIDMTDPNAREYFHLCQLKGAIRLEGLGMRHSSGRSALKHAKQTYGFTGDREQVIYQITTRTAELLSARNGGN